MCIVFIYYQKIDTKYESGYFSSLVYLYLCITSGVIIIMYPLLIDRTTEKVRFIIRVSLHCINAINGKGFMYTPVDCTYNRILSTEICSK